MTTKTRLGVAAIAASLAFVLAACSGGSPSGAATSGTTSGTTTARSTGSPASISASASATATFNDADVAFAQLMIVHHQGAIQMADLAPSRAQNQDVLALAARIKAAQAPEIDQMTSWLTAWGAAPSMMSGSATSGMGGMDMGGMDMGGTTSAAESSAMSMPGMMSGDQMQQLESASGAAFASRMNARICDSSTGSGTDPCASTASWNARTSNFAPSAASASRRRRMIVISPSLKLRAWPGQLM